MKVRNRLFVSEALDPAGPYVKMLLEKCTYDDTRCQGPFMRHTINRVRAGQPCIGNSYLSFPEPVLGRPLQLFEHRLAFLLKYGWLTDEIVIDHKNGNGLDNRWQNLRWTHSACLNNFNTRRMREGLTTNPRAFISQTSRNSYRLSIHHNVGGIRTVLKQQWMGWGKRCHTTQAAALEGITNLRNDYLLSLEHLPRLRVIARDIMHITNSDPSLQPVLDWIICCRPQWLLEIPLKDKML